MENTIYLNVFEAMPGISMLLRPDAPLFTVIAVTDDYVKAVDKTRDQLTGRSLFESFPTHLADVRGAAGDVLQASLEKVLMEKRVDGLPRHRYDMPGVEGGAEERWWSITNKPVLDEEGGVRYIIHTAVDISAQVRSDSREEALREIERVNDLFMQAPVAVCIVSGPEYKVELANETMLELMGRTKDIIGYPLEAVMTEAGQQGLLAILDTVRQTGQPYFVTNFPAEININGVREARHFDLIFKPFHTQPGNAEPDGIFCVAHNITELVSVQQQLKEQEEELRMALEVAELGSFRVDLEKDVSFSSPRINDWFGLTGQGYSLEEAFASIHEEDRERVRQSIKASLLAETQSRHDIIYRVVHPQTGQLRHMRSIGKTFFNGEGKPYVIIGIIQDITQQVEYQQESKEREAELQRRVLERTTELESLNRELRRSNDNLEEFAYAASHDMKEPIRKIHFFGERLRHRLAGKLDEEEQRHFQRMEAAAKRMSTLIDDLLLYSHVSRGIHGEEQVDLNKKVALVLEDLELEIAEKDAAISVGPLPVVKGHRRQLQQLLQNLIGNALKYSRPGVPPRISITSRIITGMNIREEFSGKDPARSYHEITISDNGIGFAQEDAERIFNVFTRLHGNAEYKGSGVGLSIVRRVAENHKGYICAESHPDEGATFRLYLPAE